MAGILGNKKGNETERTGRSLLASKKYGSNEQRAGSAMAREQAEENQRKLEAEQARQARKVETSKKQLTLKERQLSPQEWEQITGFRAAFGVNPVTTALDTAGNAVFDAAEGFYDSVGFGTAQEAQRRINQNLVSTGRMSPQEAQQIEQEREQREGVTSYKVGQVAGYLPMASNIERGVASVGKPLLKQFPNLADRLVQPIAAKLSPQAGALTRIGAQSVGTGAGRFATGATAAALEAAAQEGADVAFRQEQFDPLNVAIAGATGGVANVAAPAYMEALINAFRRPAQQAAQQQTGPILALPAPRQRGNINTAQTPDILTASGRVEPIGLPEPNIAPPTRARVQRGTGLNSVMEEIQPIVNERMTPPLENPSELAKWIQRNIGVDVRQMPYEDLRQVAEGLRRQMNVYETAVNVARERGYDLPKLLNGSRQMPDDLVQRARETQRMREVSGAGMPVKSMSDRYQPFTGTAAMPETKVGLREFAQKADPQSKLQQAAYKLKQSAATPTLKEAAARVANPIPQRQVIDITPQNSTNRQADEVVDDIELPQPDEVMPRVRDRVSSYADDLINSAKAELAKSRNRLSSNPVDVYAQYVKIGTGYMLKGSVKLADFTEAIVRDFGQEIRPYVREIFKRSKEQYKAAQKQIESEELGLTGFEAQELKDLTNINLNTADVYRNFRKVFGKHFPAIKKAVLDPFDEAKGSYAQEQKDMTERLYQEVVRGLGIRKGSKESALVQRYGEGQIDLEQLKAEAPQNWQKIAQADMWFRNEYDRLIRRVNESVARIYPNRPEKLVPYRADYYRHFQELKGWGGLVNLFDTSSAKISPGLSGVSPFVQPKTKWASFKQKRGLGEFKNDAVGGFLDYIPAASYAIHIDPHITTFRNLAKRLSSDTEQTANINNFIKFLNNFSNDLAGKTSPIDRWVEEIGGRNALRIMTRINNRVKSNVILGNVRSTLSQLANIPHGIAYGGIDAPAGAIRTVQSIFVPNEAMSKSRFLKERYLDKSFRRFDQRWWEQPRRFAEGMMEISDRVGTSFVWNTAYAKGLRQKSANPVKFADEQTRRLIGGRGIGEQPLLIKSKMFNLVSPFQLEVNNQWRVMKDFVDEKRFGALITLFVSNWLLNKAFEKMTGSGVVFDPIDALWDAATAEDVSVLQRGGRVAGEVLSNMPFGQTLAALYPEYGTNMYGVELPTRKELFGEKDPTRFGTGLLAAGAVTDPLFKLVLPWGGNQLKKSITGLDALLRGGAYTENVLTTGAKIEESKLKFPVTPNLADTARGVLFGPYATSQGQSYTKNDRRYLSENQTQDYLNAANRQQYYDELMRNRREKTEARKQKEK